jgi:hypothetical protein
MPEPGQHDDVFSWHQATVGPRQLNVSQGYYVNILTHTLVVPDDIQEMTTLICVTDAYIYIDPYGAALGYEDALSWSGHQPATLLSSHAAMLVAASP